MFSGLLLTDMVMATVTGIHVVNLYKHPDTSWSLNMTKEILFLGLSVLASLYCFVCNVDLAQGSVSALARRVWKLMRVCCHCSFPQVPV